MIKDHIKANGFEKRFPKTADEAQNKKSYKTNPQNNRESPQTFSMLNHSHQCWTQHYELGSLANFQRARY